MPQKVQVINQGAGITASHVSFGSHQFNEKRPKQGLKYNHKRVERIELSLTAWEAVALPLHHTRNFNIGLYDSRPRRSSNVNLPDFCTGTVYTYNLSYQWPIHQHAI